MAEKNINWAWPKPALAQIEEAQLAREDFVIARQGKATPRPTAAETLAIIEEALDDDKADEITTIDLSGKSDIADYMVVASGTSSRRLDSMTDHLLVKLKSSGVLGCQAEGRRTDWVLIDAVDVIVHLFRPEMRELYAIEKLWEVDFFRERAAQDVVTV